MWNSLAAASVALLLAGGTLRAESRFVHRDGPSLVMPSGQALLLRGINLGNWLEPEGYMFLFEQGAESPREIEALFYELLGPEKSADFWRRYRENYITREDIEFIRKAGFNSVRIPLHYQLFLTGDEGLRLLDRVIAWCREAHIWVILDLHCAPGGQTGTNIDDSFNYPWLFRSPKAQQETIDLWKRLAEHYHDEPAVLGYDLLNEPIPHFPALQPLKSELEPLYKRITASIRSVDRNHVVIPGGARWDGDFSVFGPPFDQNILYTFHAYWMKPDQGSVQQYVDFRKRYGVPVWLGESGENTDEWVGEYRTTLEKNNIGWCFWPYKKMEKSSAPVSIQKPPYWDEIVAFAKQPLGTGNAEKRIAARPPDGHISEAFEGLLDNVRLSRCVVRGGYIKALGLRAPQDKATTPSASFR